MMGTSPRRSFSLGTALLGCLLGCAAEKPRPPPQQAPPAAAPTFVSLLQTSERPMKEGDSLTYGTTRALPVCAFDPRVHSSAANSGLLLRFTAPVPTDLGVQLDTPLGPIRAVAPSGLEDEDRLARSGRAYFYEDATLTKDAATGAVVAREIALWPGARNGDLHLDIALWDLSFDPQTTGADRQSAPLHAALVGHCPDFALSLTHDSTELRLGEARRIHVGIAPSGDGVGSMLVSLEVTGAPTGVTLSRHDAQLASANWTAPRETTFDVSVGADAVPGKSVLTIHTRLGAIEHTAPLTLTVLPKDEY